MRGKERGESRKAYICVCIYIYMYMHNYAEACHAAVHGCEGCTWLGNWKTYIIMTNLHCCVAEIPTQNCSFSSIKKEKLKNCIFLQTILLQKETLKHLQMSKRQMVTKMMHKGTLAQKWETQWVNSFLEN